MKFTSLKNKVKGAVSYNNRRCFSANGFSLLPLALRPRLFFLIVSIVGGAMIYGGDTFASTYSLSLSTTPVIMDVSPAGGGAKSQTNSVKVVSTCPTGYTVSIQGSVNNNLYMDGNINNGETGGKTNFISASTGTVDSPAPITGSGMNTWGYNLDPNSGANGNFIGLTSTATTFTSSDVPTSSNGTTITLNYGVSVSTDRAAGSYTMLDNQSITYMATTAISCTSYEVIFNANGGTGTMDNQRIAEDSNTPLVKNTFNKIDYDFAEWNTAADGSGTSYTDEQYVSNLARVGQSITLYAQWEKSCPAGNICYYDNKANSPTAMGNQNTGTSATNATLWASNFQRPGYGFLGWSTIKNPVIGTDTIYGPMETVDINVSSSGLKLYAVWKEALVEGPIDDEEIVYMQDWRSCSSLTQATYDSNTGKLNISPNSIIVLTDKRDNQAYAVARLADGNCWMIENLRLEAENTRGSANQALAQGYGGVFTGLADPETANFSNDATANSLYSAASIGGGDYVAYRIPRYNNDNTNTNTTINPNTTVQLATGNNQNIFSYGNYYNWPAAIADTTRYRDNNQSATGISICPNGWHLPIGGDKNNMSNSDFWELGVSLFGAAPNNISEEVPYYSTSNELRRFPTNFIYSAFYVDSWTSVYRGKIGEYVSATVGSNSKVYTLRIDDDSSYPGNYSSYKSDGNSIRCMQNN